MWWAVQDSNRAALTTPVGRVSNQPSATTTTAACGGNREPRLGPRSDFSKPCQGAAEKSANATRRCCLARGSQRLGMSTGMTAVLGWTVQDLNRDKQRQDILMKAVSCLLLILTVYGILDLVQQLGTCRGEAPPSCCARPFGRLKAPPGCLLLRCANANF